MVIIRKSVEVDCWDADLGKFAEPHSDECRLARSPLSIQEKNRGVFEGSDNPGQPLAKLSTAEDVFPGRKPLFWANFKLRGK